MIVDRIEGETAILETDAGMVEIPAALLPPGAGEGDVLALVIDHPKTAVRKERIAEKLKNLFSE